MSSQELIHAYRALYRAGLQAVQFSKPARYTLRDQLRKAFRDEKAGPAGFDPEAVRRTVWFLRAAAAERGLEHRIVKNLLRTAWERKAGRDSWKRVLMLGKMKPRTDVIGDTAWRHYELTVKLLNQTMGLCLR